MSIEIIQERLNSYHCSSKQEEERALKEICQEVALAGLSRTDFFKHALFQGGTCLRILYSLERFSEDLDFILRSPDQSFEWERYLRGLEIELGAYDIELFVEDRSKADAAVKKAFLKSDSIGKLLQMKYKSSYGRPSSIRIKFELDTNPPAGSGYETRYLDFPFPFPITAQDPPSLFAGKSHALLCREYAKGRDWYDFIWYTSRRIKVNFEFLSNALNQLGKWKDKQPKITKEWYCENMKQRIETIDWNEAKRDIVRFLRPRDLPTLALWNKEFFLDRLKKVNEYL